jgi:hypothetical protein
MNAERSTSNFKRRMVKAAILQLQGSSKPFNGIGKGRD